MGGKIIRLHKVVERFNSGGTPSTKNLSHWVGDLPWVTGSDFLHQEVIVGRRYISDEAVEQSATRRVAEGTLLLLTRTGVGKMAQAPCDLAISQDITALVLKNEFIDTAYLYHQLLALSHNFERWKQGTSIQGLDRRDLEAIRISCPDIADQKRIVMLFDRLEAVRSSSRSNLAQLEFARISLMRHLMIKYESASASYLGELFDERKESGNEDLPILSVTMNRGLVTREELGRKVESELTPEQHLLVRKGDIAYNMMRMWQGVSGLAECDGLVSPAYVVLKPTDKIDPLFASYLFKVPEVIRLFHRFSQGLTNDRLRLYYDQFKDIKVSVPESVEEQRRIAKLLQSFNEKAEALKARIKQLTRLKTALSQEIFN